MVAEVVREELGGLLRGQSMAQYNEAFLEQHGTQSLRHRAAAARMMVLLDPDAKAAAAKMVVKRGGLLGESSFSLQSLTQCAKGTPFRDLGASLPRSLQDDSSDCHGRHCTAMVGLPSQVSKRKCPSRCMCIPNNAAMATIA